MNLTRPITLPSGFTVTLTVEVVLLAPRLSGTMSENVSVIVAVTVGAGKFGCAIVGFVSATSARQRSESRRRSRPCRRCRVLAAVERDGAPEVTVGLVPAFEVGVHCRPGAAGAVEAMGPGDRRLRRSCRRPEQRRARPQGRIDPCLLYRIPRYTGMVALLQASRTVVSNCARAACRRELCAPSRGTLADVLSVNQSPFRPARARHRSFSS